MLIIMKDRFLQKCPFKAISIINLSSNLKKETTHRYSKNSFKLHRLPIPRPGEVLGLVRTATALTSDGQLCCELAISAVPENDISN